MHIMLISVASKICIPLVPLLKGLQTQGSFIVDGFIAIDLQKKRRLYITQATGRQPGYMSAPKLEILVVSPGKLLSPRKDPRGMSFSGA
jgi:hypothetical protein